MDNRHYKILQINPSASKEDIKKAYRNLVKKFHPDVNKSSNASSYFKKITKAYEYLTQNYEKIEYEREKARQKRAQQTTRNKPKSRTTTSSSNYQYAKKEPYSPPPKTTTPTTTKTSSGISWGWYVIPCMWLIMKLSQCS